MTSAHIGQKQQIGLGKETTPGTGVAASIWIPKISGSFLPKTQYAYDEGAYFYSRRKNPSFLVE
jgi:hypothetical protein